MDVDKFIANQLRFVYGKYFDNVIGTGSLFIDKSAIVDNMGDKNWNRGAYNTLVSDILANRANSSHLGANNKICFPSLCDTMKRFWPSDKPSDEYIIRFNFSDFMHFNEFVVTNNRPFQSINQVLFPYFSYQHPSVIRIADSIPFGEKRPIVFWRGQTSGRHLLNLNIRCQIVMRNFSIHPNIDIGFSDFVFKVYQENKTLLDAYFKKGVDKMEQLKCKFILNLEGNDVSTSFIWALASNCCPLHNYPFSCESWFFGQGLEPYVHFVPIKNDGSDLLSQYEWCTNSLDKCEEIALAGKRYMEPYLDEDIFNKTLQRFVELYPLKIKA
jgi:hypothetical protein